MYFLFMFMYSYMYCYVCPFLCILSHYVVLCTDWFKCGLCYDQRVSIQL